LAPIADFAGCPAGFCFGAGRTAGLCFEAGLRFGGADLARLRTALAGAALLGAALAERREREDLIDFTMTGSDIFQPAQSTVIPAPQP
jgi:hypothetical protein